MEGGSLMSRRPTSAEVREHLQAYLLGVESLPDFHRWFVGWRHANPHDGDAMTHDIALRLAEYTRGHWTEPQLRGKLLELLEVQTMAPRVEVDAPPWRAAGGSFAALFETAAPASDPG
jgi:hypothetical protein